MSQSRGKLVTDKRNDEQTDTGKFKGPPGRSKNQHRKFINLVSEHKQYSSIILTTLPCVVPKALAFLEVIVADDDMVADDGRGNTFAKIKNNRIK